MSGLSAQFHSRRNHGALERFTHYGVSGEPGSGPYVQLWLLVEGGQIVRAGYQTNGCLWSLGIASVVTEILIGRSVEKALLLEAQGVGALVGEIPEGKGHIPGMVVEALRRALSSVAQSSDLTDCPTGQGETT